MNLKALIGSGDKFALFTAPFLAAGGALNIAYPGAFGVGGPPPVLKVISTVVLAADITVWAWSASTGTVTSRLSGFPGCRPCQSECCQPE